MNLEAPHIHNIVNIKTWHHIFLFLCQQNIKLVIASYLIHHYSLHQIFQFVLDYKIQKYI